MGKIAKNALRNVAHLDIVTHNAPRSIEEKPKEDKRTRLSV